MSNLPITITSLLLSHLPPAPSPPLALPLLLNQYHLYGTNFNDNEEAGKNGVAEGVEEGEEAEVEDDEEELFTL
jgi:hypothetical protein